MCVCVCMKFVYLRDLRVVSYFSNRLSCNTDIQNLEPGIRVVLSQGRTSCSTKEHQGVEGLTNSVCMHRFQ